MPARRSLMDRLLMRVEPRPLPACVPEPRELVPGLWALDRELRFPGGARLPCRTTMIRRSNGALIVVSPPALVTPAAAASIDSIGTVEEVVVPNTFHYVYAREFLARYPDAALLVAPGLRERVPGLPAAQEFGRSAPPAWSNELELSLLGPVGGVSEAILFHVPTRTLILTDLAFNLTRFARPIDRLSWRLSGIPSAFGPGRTSRRLLLRDRDEARRSLRVVSEWPFERIVVAHGDAVEHDAKGQFLRAFGSYL
jgi:hypothetical protein